MYGWRNIDKEPIQKVPTAKKGKHLKQGAGRPISYTQKVDKELLTWVLRQQHLCLGIYLITRTQTALPIVQYFGFLVAILQFHLQLFWLENLKLIICAKFFRRNTVW